MYTEFFLCCACSVEFGCGAKDCSTTASEKRDSSDGICKRPSRCLSPGKPLAMPVKLSGGSSCTGGGPTQLGIPSRRSYTYVVFSGYDCKQFPFTYLEQAFSTTEKNMVYMLFLEAYIIFFHFLLSSGQRLPPCIISLRCTNSPRYIPGEGE